MAVRRHRSAGIEAGIVRNRFALAGREVMLKDVRIAELVGGVIKHELSRGPTRCGDNGFILGNALVIVTVEIGNINFAGWTGIHFESDPGLSDAFFAGHGLHDIVRESVNLAPQGGPRVGFGELGGLALCIEQTSLNMAVVTAGDLVLGRFWRGKAKALDVEVQLERPVNLTGKTADRNRDGLGATHD